MRNKEFQNVEQTHQKTFLFVNLVFPPYKRSELKKLVHYLEVRTRFNV